MPYYEDEGEKIYMPKTQIEEEQLESTNYDIDQVNRSAKPLDI